MDLQRKAQCRPARVEALAPYRNGPNSGRRALVDDLSILALRMIPRVEPEGCFSENGYTPRISAGQAFPDHALGLFGGQGLQVEKLVPDRAALVVRYRLLWGLIGASSGTRAAISIPARARPSSLAGLLVSNRIREQFSI